MKKMLAIFQKLADNNPTVSEYQYALSQVHHNIGFMVIQAGKPAAALAEKENERIILQKLADTNSSVTVYQRELATSQENMKAIIGRLWGQKGKPAETLEEYEKAQAIVQKLADAKPAVTMYQGALAKIHNIIGWLHARQSRFEDSFAALNRSLVISQKLTQENPDNSEYTAQLGYSYAYRGWANFHAGHPAEAASDLRHALEQWAKSKNPSIDNQFELCLTMALLAVLNNDPRSGVNSTEASAFSKQAVAALQNAIKAGWSQINDLNEPDFDSIRSREDFKDLVSELTNKAKKDKQLKPDQKN